MKKENFIMLIVGKKGSGKSYFADKFSMKLKRLLVFDTMRIFDNATPVYSIKKLEKIVNDIKNNKIIEFRYSIRVNNKYFEYVNSLILSLSNLTYIVDEIQVYCNASKIPENLNVLITEGRHFEINFIFITQRPARLPIIIITNLDVLIIFETQNSRDLDIIESFKYSDIDAIKNLKEYQFYCIDLKHKKGYIGKYD